MATNKRIIRSNDEAAGGASFNTVLYTGNDLNPGPILDVGFEPDFIWIKSRETLKTHRLHDIVRGADRTLFSDTTDAEAVSINRVDFRYSDTQARITSASDGWNELNKDYVAWCWKAGGAAVTNTDGTITSQVSANPAAGFSIVSYTGQGALRTVGHGLSTAPSWVIVKNRSQADAWAVYYGDSSNYMELNQNYAASGSGDIFQQSHPTDSIFYIGTNHKTGANNENYIAYCFAEVAGFSKFGSYTGTGSAGNFVSTSVDGDAGFEPAFVMIKQTTNIGSDNHWCMWDNKRIEYDMLRANTSDAEFAGPGRIRFLENGFEMLDSDTSRNASGASYIYMAFANQF